MRKICKFIPTLSHTKAYLNIGEVFSKDLSEVQTQKERLRVSWKRWEHASCFENLAKPPSTENRKWIMFSIELFWGSIFEGEGVSHPKCKVWEKLRNKSYAFFEFMKPGFALFPPYCSGRAKSGCGGVLAVDFYDFYRQHFSRIHDLRANTNQIWFILTSSTSFGEHLNAGITCMKFGQNGRNPRPAGLGQAGRPIPHGVRCSSLVRMLMSANASQSNVVSYKMHKPRPKGLSHEKMGPPEVTRLRNKSWTILWRNAWALIDMSVQQTVDTSQIQAGRPTRGRPAP